MIGACMRKDSPFGVLLIRDGHEAGPASTFEVGTLARITDFYQGSDGLLGVTAIGERRFRLLAAERQPDGLNIGEIELLPEESPQPLPGEYQHLSHILAGVLDDLGRLYESLERRYDDAGWLSYRFVEVLPIDLEQKQACLEDHGPLERLRLIDELLASVRGPGEAPTGS